jgi:ABC-type transport system substrate-binding protein
MVGQWFLFDGLLKDWWNGDVTPALAESWDIDMDEPSVTFHLRKDVKFHDGTDFNAEAVKWNYDYFIEAMKHPEWKAFEVIDTYTVKAVFNYWTNDNLRPFESDPVVSPTAFMNAGDTEEQRIDWAMNNPVGTGPFILESFQQDVRMVAKKNPNYWNAGKPYFDQFEVIYIPDYTTAKAALQAGEADAMLVEFGKQTSDFASAKDFIVFAQPQATTFLVTDDAHADSPFYDQKVREAIDYALDREWLAENLGYGQYQPCYQLSPRTNLAYDPNYVGRQHNVDTAKQLLADAGYPTGLKTQLLPCPLGLQRDVWVAVQSQLAAVGIDAELKFLDMAAFNDYRTPGTWQNAIVGDTCPSWGNMAVGLNMMFGTGPFFNSMDKNRPDWVEAIAATLSGTKWNPELNRKAEQILYKNASVIPVTEAGRGYVYRSTIKDGNFGARGAYFWAWDWEYAWFDN